MKAVSCYSTPTKVSIFRRQNLAFLFFFFFVIFFVDDDIYLSNIDWVMENREKKRIMGLDWVIKIIKNLNMVRLES